MQASTDFIPKFQNFVRLSSWFHSLKHSFLDSQRDLESSKFNIKIIGNQFIFFLQINFQTDAFDDETLIPDEEESTCEERILNLHSPKFFFSKLYPFQNRNILGPRQAQILWFFPDSPSKSIKKLCENNFFHWSQDQISVFFLIYESPQFLSLNSNFI